MPARTPAESRSPAGSADRAGSADPDGPPPATGRTQAQRRDDWRTTFRPDIPSSARIYDYFLGGKDNYPADRQAAQQIASYLPNIREAARVNRAFVRRAVRYLVNEAGIRQLIDIGTGLATMGNVHEVAMEADPAARVVYVDHDPVVLAHARNMLHAERRDHRARHARASRHPGRSRPAATRRFRRARGDPVRLHAALPARRR